MAGTDAAAIVVHSSRHPMAAAKLRFSIPPRCMLCLDSQTPVAREGVIVYDQDSKEE